MTKELLQSYNDLLAPSDKLVNDVLDLDGDIIILGAGGKMGPALARLAKDAVVKAGSPKKVIAVSRFTEQGLEKELQKAGIETISADLLNDKELDALPVVKNVLYLAGTKFGTTGNESFTWAMNCYLPGRVAEKFRDSRIVAFSTGNIYPMVPVVSGGARESQVPEPLGEYAQSCLGRERIFQYQSSRYNTPTLIYRLNFANDVTYGVLLEIAKSVREEMPVNVEMGAVNIIWQGDANEIAIRCLHHCAVPAKILNVTGPEILSVRWVAEIFGQMMGKTPVFEGQEKDTAYLANAHESVRLFGYPRTPPLKIMELMMRWLDEGGKLLNKPTHFQERKGKY